MGRWTMLTNVGFAEVGTARCWCHFVTIDMEANDSFGGPVRQIRGGTYGGMPVFTVWIDPDCEVRMEAVDGGRSVLLSHDGNTYNLDGGIVIRAGDRTVGIGPDDFRQPIKVESIEQRCYPFGDEVDERILPFSGGKAYPRAVWTAIPERFRVAAKTEG